MPRINLTVRHQHLELHCKEGEEERLKEAARRLELRLSELQKTIPQAKEFVLLLLASLMMEDALLAREWAGSTPEQTEQYMQSIQRMATRIENLANRLENE